MIRSGRKILSALLLAMIVLAALPITAYAASPADVIIGNSYTLESGKTLNDDLFIVGGSVNLMGGSSVQGDVFLLGGSLTAGGTITGNITVLGGTLNLESTFVLNGNLTTAGASVNRDPGAQVNGQIRTGENIQYFILPGGFRVPNIRSGFDPIFRVISFFLQLFLWALVAMLVAVFIPAHLTRVSQTALSQPLYSGGLGLLTAIVLPIILVLLLITICLIPVSFIGAFLLLIAWAFGLMALGYEIGQRVGRAFQQVWHPAISAGLGTLILMAGLNGLEAIVPCVGWIPKLVVSVIGLGAVLLTQFGTKTYTPSPSLPPSSTIGTQPG